MSNGANDIDLWESGQLGASLEHARAAPPELEAEVDAALGLEKIELRLSVALITGYKTAAAQQGIGYKPLMRLALSQYLQAQGQPATNLD